MIQYTLKLAKQIDSMQTNTSTRQSIGAVFPHLERYGFSGEPIFEEAHVSQLESSGYAPSKMEIFHMQDRSNLGSNRAGSRPGSVTSTQRNHSPRRMSPVSRQKKESGSVEQARQESTALKKTYCVEYREVLTNPYPRHSFAPLQTESTEQGEHGLSRTLKTGNLIQTNDFSVCPKYLACTSDFRCLPYVHDSRSPRGDSAKRERNSPALTTRRPGVQSTLQQSSGVRRNGLLSQPLNSTHTASVTQQHQQESMSTAGPQRVHGVYHSERFDFIQNYNEMVVKMRLLEKENKSLKAFQEEIRDETGPSQLAIQRHVIPKEPNIPTEFNHLSPISGEKGPSSMQLHAKTPITMPTAERIKERYERTEGQSSVAFQLSTSTEKKDPAQRSISKQKVLAEEQQPEIQIKNPDMNQEIRKGTSIPSPSKHSITLFDSKAVQLDQQERDSELLKSRQLIESLNKDKEALNEELLNIRRELNALRYASTQNANTVQVNQSGKAEQEEARRRELIEKASRLEVENLTLQSQVQKLTYQTEELTKLLQAKEYELSRALQQISDLDNLVKSLRSQKEDSLSPAKQPSSDLEAKLRKLEAERDGLKQELDQFNSLLGVGANFLNPTRKFNRHSRSFNHSPSSSPVGGEEVPLNRRLSVREGTTSPHQELENLGDIEDEDARNNYEESISAQVKQIQEIALNLGTPGKKLGDLNGSQTGILNLSSINLMGLNHPENKSLVERILGCQAVIIQMLKRENKDLAAEYKNKYSSWNNEKEELKFELERARISERDTNLKLSQALELGNKSALESSRVIDSTNLGNLVQQKAELKVACC